MKLKGDIGVIRKFMNPFFEKTPILTPEKRTFQPGNAFDDTAFKPGFQIDRL